MQILVYGAGVIGTLLAAQLHDAGNHVSLVARGHRLAALQEHGVLIAEADSSAVRQVPIAVVEKPAGPYDLIVVALRTHQVEDVLESLDGQNGDVLFLLNWAAGPEPLAAAIGRERVLLGFPATGGTMDGDVVRYRRSLLTRLVSMPIGEPDGGVSPRLKRIVQSLRSSGIRAKAEPRMDAWLKTHAAFELPLGQAVHGAGGLDSLARNPAAIRDMIRRMRQNFRALPTRPVPRAFSALQIVPESILVPVFRRFLRSEAATPLSTDSPAVTAELDRLAEQLATVTHQR
jgi:2-dehydropantoate 2-reductase